MSISGASGPRRIRRSDSSANRKASGIYGRCHQNGGKHAMLESRQLGGAMHEVRLGPDSLGMRQLTVIDLPITAQ
jgi:hypothetical protein